MLAKTAEFFRVLGEVAQVLPALKYKMAEDDEKRSLGALFEDTVSRYPDNTMLLFEGREWTYSQFNGEVNQLAHLLAERGIKRGDSVALLMENRAEFLLSMLAIVKLGASASLINNSLTGNGLVHCIEATGAKACIVGEERASVIADVRDSLTLDAARYFWMVDTGETDCPQWAENLAQGLAEQSRENPAITREISAGETALYIFTSGTTGLPKAALVLHRKILAAGEGMGQVGFRIKPEDRLYLCLPIYHITGMGPGLCGFLSKGASIFLRRQFSASNFWPEVQRYQTNCFIYVGELCRYLAGQPECAEEKNNPLEKMMGNGLRPDVWDEFKQRFGVKRISEIYGSSEGNVSTMNVFNKDKTVGTALVPVALVQYDVENDEIIRDTHGRCLEVAPGQPGLMLGKISEKAAFDGYTNKEATEKKIVRNALEDGDAWFNTGDLLRQVDVGFAMGMKHYQFVDRTGDTFRWRAENVSTNEVGEVINLHPQVNMANVYGVEVPGAEGKAGMVAFELADGEELDIAEFQAIVERELPPYAQPVFIRVQSQTETTVTFKLVKGDLRKQSFHLDKAGGDKIYVRKPRSDGYELLQQDFYQQLLDGNGGY